MRLVVRLIVGAFGLILAISAGTTFLVVASAFDPTLGDFAHRVFWTGFMELWDWLEQPGPMPAGYAVAVYAATTTLLVAPPVAIAVAGEIWGTRSLAWYAVGTAALTAAIPWLARASMRTPTAAEGRITLALFLTGAVAGLVYWLFAGRSAGRER
jgi:hypothetical protein